MANTVVIGAGIGFILSVTMLPAMFSLLPINARKRKSYVLEVLKNLGELIYKFKERFIIVITAICIAVFSLLPNLHFDDYFSTYFDRVPEWLEVKNTVDPEFGSSFYIFSDMQSNEPDGITNPEYLKKLDEFESWLLTQPEVLMYLLFQMLLRLCIKT